MIVRDLSEIEGTEKVVEAPNWTSLRFLLADDGMGFSMHDTRIKPGTATKMWYRNHLEAVYCVAGSGEIEDLETGEVHPIQNGTFYALDNHDRHVLRAETELRMICVFNPPLHGEETHDEDGAYPLAEVTPAGEVAPSVVVAREPTSRSATTKESTR